MNNPEQDSTKTSDAAAAASTLSYKGPVSGLRGLLTNKLAEGLANVVSTVDRVSEIVHGKTEGGTEKIALEKIYPAPDQPRQVFDPKALEELSQTMRELGQAQAITVRRTPQGYEIISGERRYRAAKLAGLTELDCVVKDCSPREARLFALVENVQRQDLLPVEEAHYLRKVLSENSDLSLEKLAKSLGSHKSTLSEKIQLTEVPEDLQPYLYAKGKHLTHRHWRVISRIPDEAFLRETFLRAVEHQMSVAELEKSLQAAGIRKAARRREGNSAQRELPLSANREKVLNLCRVEGQVLRMKSAQIDLNQMSAELKAELAAELEKTVKLLTSN
ncbi:MAG: ParB/RepB/Spo0J family partition protein [Bdellovibrionales bacterium]|nr:ParB/RepB/Spo0J family partition protein [Bdellovibrionales bacterium]